jgi:PAS domain S-box-containing protein
MLGLWAADLRESFDPPWLLFTLNFLFATLASVVIVYFVSGTFLATGKPGLFLLNCGAVFWGLAGATSAAVGGSDYNASLTIHNVCAWLAAFCHLTGVVLLNRAGRIEQNRVWWLLAGFVGAASAVAFVAYAALAGWIPTFFVQGQGGTLVRHLVLASTGAMFVLSAVVLRRGDDAGPSFARWYALALLAFAAAMFGLMIQSYHGSALGWTARSAQWVGGIYLLAAAVVAARESPSKEVFLSVSPDQKWLRYTLAVVFVAAALTVRLVFLSSLGVRGLVVTFYPAVILAALYGRRGPGLVAAGLSALAMAGIWTRPAGQSGGGQFADWLTIAIFLVSSTVIVWVTEALQESRARVARVEAEAQAAAEQRRAEEAARKAEQRLAGVLESMTDGFQAVDSEWRYIFLNAAAKAILSAHGRDPDALIGRTMWDAFPDLLGTGMERVCRRVMAERQPAWLEHFHEAWGRWFDLRVFPTADSGMSILLRDITARKQAEAALRDAHGQLADRAGQLEELVRRRTAKLQEMVDELQHVSYAMAHDMRAPLRAMNAFATLLAEEGDSATTPAEAREYIRRIIVAANRLDGLILDALNYTKVAQQGMPLGPVDLSKLLHDLIETYPNLHIDKADILVEGLLPMVIGNDSLLTQCFSNLLGNAVKFVPPGVKPVVRVRAETRGDMARIWVTDNGIGIPKNAQSRLFNMFQKLDNGYEGTGVGLAIVRKVVERTGGTVGLDSEPGTGSRFWVELPLATGANAERTLDS